MSDLVEPSSDEAPLSRREQQKEEKNKALIDAALAVFSRVGFAAAKMDDVAREAGVSKGTVYLYFDSKEQLFEEMVKANMAPLMTEIAENLARPSISATERLKSHMKFFYTKILNTNRRRLESRSQGLQVLRAQ